MALHKHQSSHGPGIEKAKEILRHGEVRGKSLSRAQRGFFGARAGGASVRGLQASAIRRKISK